MFSFKPKIIVSIILLSFLVCFAEDDSGQTEIPDITDIQQFRIEQLFGANDDEVTIHFKLTKGTYYAVYYDLKHLVDKSQVDHCHSDQPFYEVYWANVFDGGYYYSPIHDDPNFDAGIHHKIYFAPGIHHQTFKARWNNPHMDWPGYFKGIEFKLAYVKLGNCPDSQACVKTTCNICNHDYCANHESHFTGVFNHSQIPRFTNDNTIHYHCSNSQALIQQWQNQILGYCSICGQQYCRICGHKSCDNQEGSCPNLPTCKDEACPICEGHYCSTHNFHLCSGYTDYGSGFVSAPFTVQTTSQGTANVTVNVSTNTDVEQIATSTSELERQVRVYINEGIAEVNTQLAEQLGIQNSMNNNIVSIGALVGAINTVAQDNSTKLQSMINNGELTKEQITDMKNKIELIRLEDLRANDVIITQMTGVEGTLGVIRNYQQESNEKVEDIESNTSDISDKLDDTNSSLGSIAGGVNSANNNLISLGQLLVQLKNQSSQQSSQTQDKIDGVKGSVDGVKGSVDGVKGSVDGVKDSVDGLQSTADNILDKLSSGSGSNLTTSDIATKDYTVTSMTYGVRQSFEQLHSKLIPSPPQGSGTLNFAFDIPFLDSTYTVNLNFDDDRLSPLFTVCRAICIIGYALACIYGTVKVLRQY